MNIGLHHPYDPALNGHPEAAFSGHNSVCFIVHVDNVACTFKMYESLHASIFIMSCSCCLLSLLDKHTHSWPIKLSLVLLYTLLSNLKFSVLTVKDSVTHTAASGWAMKSTKQKPVRRRWIHSGKNSLTWRFFLTHRWCWRWQCGTEMLGKMNSWEGESQLQKGKWQLYHNYCVVVQFYPWFNFHCPLFLCMGLM